MAILKQLVLSTNRVACILYEVREYLLEKWGRNCAYCGATDTRLEIDHIHPRSKGGSDRVSNLTIACHDCNQAKGNQNRGLRKVRCLDTYGTDGAVEVLQGGGESLPSIKKYQQLTVCQQSILTLGCKWYN